INQAFTPSAPINSTDLFAGRIKQIQRVMGAIFQRGQHAIIFGERGVGKTSLSNTIFDFLVLRGKHEFQVARFNCSVAADFTSIWRTVLKSLTVERGPENETRTLDELLPENPGSENIREIFQNADSPSIIIVDEIDRIEDSHTGTLLADTVKTLSDHSVNTTLIFVGVADSVEQLIAEHQSIDRALVQIQMPRMSSDELAEIVDKGLFKCEMTIDDEAKQRIAALSRGLPHNTHLLARHAALTAADNGRAHITAEDLSQAIKDAVENQQQTTVSAYHKATHSPRKNLYKEVLLACALAPKDELGYFSAGAIREPMTMITGRDYDIPAFSQHLKEFCDNKRGPILQKFGEGRRFRFRFINPMMEPSVVLRGISDKIIEPDQIWTSSEPPPLFELS
ncbi:MAG TPA: AAA family ATPase, partial [Terriglobales bacterium]